MHSAARVSKSGGAGVEASGSLVGRQSCDCLRPEHLVVFHPRPRAQEAGVLYTVTTARDSLLASVQLQYKAASAHEVCQACISSVQEDDPL